MELLQAQLKKGGINLVLKSFDKEAYSDNKKKKNFTFTFSSGGSAKWDTDSALSDFHPNSKSNYMGVNDPKLTGLLEAQRREADPAKRRELVRQVGRHIVENAYSVGMYSEINYQIWHPYLKNYAPNWNISGWPLENSWLEKG